MELNIEVGRDKDVMNDYADDIFTLANENSINVTERKIDFDYSVHDFVFAAGWRWLIKGVAANQLIIIHDSLLPKYRGFCPLFNALLNKESHVGVTALFGSDKYDAGGIITQSKIKVKYPIKITEAVDLISVLYQDIANTIVGYIKNNHIPFFIFEV